MVVNSQNFITHGTIDSTCKKRKKTMTSCTVATCDAKNGSPKAIAVADRMVTFGDLSVAYEHDTSKIWELSENSVALTAGDALEYVDLCRQVMDQIPPRARLPILDVTEKVKDEYLKLRMKKVEEEYFALKGFSIAWFYQNQSILNETLILRLDKLIEDYSFNLYLLIAGVDERGAHIYYVHPPNQIGMMGAYSCYDSMGYCTMGTGQGHSDMVFVANKYTPSLPLKDALFICYEAKKRAEVAVGVGKDFTDVSIIDKNGVTPLKDTVEELEKIYQQSLNMEKSRKSEIQKSIDQLEIKELEDRS